MYFYIVKRSSTQELIVALIGTFGASSVYRSFTPVLQKGFRAFFSRRYSIQDTQPREVLKRIFEAAAE